MPLFRGKCKSKARLDGKTAVVTGCNTGIGKETVRDFVNRGCRVIMACRDIKKAEAAATEISRELSVVAGVGTVVVVRLDLSSFASVRQCAAELLRTEPQINLLINNAGVAFCPKSLTEDGFETQFATNHLGHFLFTLLLLPRILTSTPARIVNVSSLLHEIGKIKFDDINMDKKYSPTGAYNNSKLANVLFSKELSNRLGGAAGVTTYSLHPGTVDTEAGRHYDTAFFPGSKWILNNIVSVGLKTAKQGAQTTIYCAVDEKLASESGLYYSDCKKTKPSSRARDPKLAVQLWEESVKMVGLDNYDPFSTEALTEALALAEAVAQPIKTDVPGPSGAVMSESVALPITTDVSGPSGVVMAETVAVPMKTEDPGPSGVDVNTTHAVANQEDPPGHLPGLVVPASEKLLKLRHELEDPVKEEVPKQVSMEPVNDEILKQLQEKQELPKQESIAMIPIKEEPKRVPVTVESVKEEVLKQVPIEVPVNEDVLKQVADNDNLSTHESRTVISTKEEPKQVPGLTEHVKEEEPNHVPLAEPIKEELHKEVYAIVTHVDLESKNKTTMAGPLKMELPTQEPEKLELSKELPGQKLFAMEPDEEQPLKQEQEPSKEEIVLEKVTVMTSVQMEPAKAAPVEPAPVEPAHVEPAPVEPARVAPAYVEPAPVEPYHMEPAPMEPAPVEPASVEPASVAPTHVEPASVEPASVEPDKTNTPNIRVSFIVEL